MSRLQGQQTSRPDKSCFSYSSSFAVPFLSTKTFNPDIQQLETHTAEITPCFCLDLSLITPAFSLPAPTYIPCGDSHLSPPTPGMPPWPNRQLFVLEGGVGGGGGVKPLSRLLLIGLQRLLLSGQCITLTWFTYCLSYITKRCGSIFIKFKFQMGLRRSVQAIAQCKAGQGDTSF